MMINIFPFVLRERESQEMFNAYYAENKDEIIEKYGYTNYVGRSDRDPSGYRKVWSYWSVRTTIINNTKVKFETFGNAHNRTIETMEWQVPAATVKAYIQCRKMQIAEAEYEKREDEAAALIKKAKIDSIHAELFKPKKRGSSLDH